MILKPLLRNRTKVKDVVNHIKILCMEAVSLEHLRELAYRAHYNTSFDPRKRADSVIKEYTEELRSDLMVIGSKTSETISAEDIKSIQSRYQEKYEKHLSDWLHSHSNVASSAITGPAKFPVARMEKYRKWADNKYEYFREWRHRALKAITKKLTPPVNELEQARQKLKSREENHQVMLEANKIIRKGGSDVEAKLKNLGLADHDIADVLHPKYNMRPGFGSYSLQLNKAEIKRLSTRVAILEAKENLAKTQGEKTEEIDGIKMVHNYQADRLQLFFDGKPDTETISRLKSNGFHWTPSQRAWQRKLTNQAVYAAKNVIKGPKM